MEQLVFYSAYIMLGLTAAVLILFVLVIALWIRQGRMRKNYLRLLNGGQAENVEKVLLEIQTSISRLNHESGEQSKILDAIQEKLRGMKARVGITRFNAFERGHDMSFSIAVLNELQDGFVLTGIHNREDMYVYAKPVERGQSKYSLTPEEKEAISRSS